MPSRRTRTRQQGLALLTTALWLAGAPGLLAAQTGQGAGTAAVPGINTTVPGMAQRIVEPASKDAALVQRGEALFSGKAPLRGSLVGQSLTLPPAALSCRNCHQATGGRPAIGSALSAASLRTPAVRRGGPPSYYTEASLCTLLADGVDPSQVLVDTTMPRYTLAAADCRALWAYFMQQP